MRGARGAVTVLLASLLAGCSLFFDLDPGVRDPSGDADGGPGNGDGGGGDSDAGPCGSVGRLQDSFEPGALSSHWIPRTLGAEASAPAINGDGRLEAGFATAPATDDEYSEVESRFAYDLRGHAITAWTDVDDDRSWSTIEVREAGRFDSARRIIALGRKGTVFAAFVRAPEVSVLRQEVFGASYRYWRIREVAGALEFEASGDNRVFSHFTTLELPGIDLGSVMVGLAVNADVTPTTVGVTRFDDLNAGETADPACPMRTLRDDFTGGSLGPRWIDDSSGCTVATGDGVLVTASPGATCVVDSSHAYSIDGGGELIAELTSFPIDAASRAELRLAHDDDNYLTLQQQNGELRIVLVEDGVGGDPTTLPNAVNSQWWRVREQGGELEIATGPDSSSFSIRGTVRPRDLDLSELRVSFQLRASSADSAKLGRVNPAP